MLTNMEQVSGLRQVSKQYKLFRMSASLIGTSTSQIHHWRGCIDYPDTTPSVVFEFYNQGDTTVLQAPRLATDPLPPEAKFFAEFCSDVLRAQI